MSKSRSQKALLNTIAGFSDEIVAFICGLILPRLILTTFGSSYNGITSSITQFISCISLMKAGIGGVTRASLYKPLAEKNTYDISTIVAQTEKFMRKIALLFVGFVLVFAIIYPIWISTDFDWIFSFTLILIISLSTFAQYFFGLTYQMVLNADQKQNVTLLVNMVATILNTIIAVIIIMLGGNIHIVKLGSTFVAVLSSLYIYLYVRKKYNINYNVHTTKDLIKQRWDAVGHEIANFINTNTDIILLTIFTTLGEVSVYTVYQYVIVAIRKIVSNFITGFGAAFGNMYAKNENELMYSNLKIYELIIFSIVSIIYSVTYVMITSFAMIYTSGVHDVDYYRPLFGIILTLAGAFSCYRIPYETIVKAVGHYKQTRNGAFAEAIINIVVSVICIKKYGIVGVAIGTLLAAIFRTFQYAIYLGRNIIHRNIFLFINHLMISLGISIITFIISRIYIIEIENIYQWIFMAFITTIIAGVLTIITNFIFFSKDQKVLINKIKDIIKKEK